MTTAPNDMPTWASGPLHAALVQALPLFSRDVFSGSPRLDVYRLAKSLIQDNGRHVSAEGVYKWLRANRLTPRNVRMLLDLATGAENVAVLDKLGHKRPKIDDFSPFVFA